VLAGSIDVTGTVDVSGSTGGTVAMASVGTLDLAGRGNAHHRARDESGGDVTLDAATLSVRAGASVTARGGSDASGGDVLVRASGDLQFEGSVDVSGGDGGDIELSGRGLEVAGTATLRTDATL